MSQFSELNLEKQVGISALTLMGLGLATEEGRAGFTEQGVIGGAGTSLGAGIKLVAGVPISFFKGVGTAFGITGKEGGPEVPTDVAEKLKLEGLIGQLTKAVEEKPATPAATTPEWLLPVAIGIAAVALILALKIG